MLTFLCTKQEQLLLVLWEDNVNGAAQIHLLQVDAGSEIAPFIKNVNRTCKIFNFLSLCSPSYWYQSPFSYLCKIRCTVGLEQILVTVKLHSRLRSQQWQVCCYHKALCSEHACSCVRSGLLPPLCCYSLPLPMRMIRKARAFLSACRFLCFCHGC